MYPSYSSPLLKKQISLNTFLSPLHKILYVATPKVGCTSMKWWFAELIGVSSSILEYGKCNSCESAPDLVIHDTLHQLAPHCTGLNITALSDALLSSDYFRFCLVRNPYTRIFSAWQSKWLLNEPLQHKFYPQIEAPSDFYSVDCIRLAFVNFLRMLVKIQNPDEFDIHVAPQWALLEPEKINYQIVAHIEDTSLLVQSLTEHLGPRFNNPFVNRPLNTSLLDYSKSWISDEAAELIRIIYARDFELFGYDEMLLPQGADSLTEPALGVALRGINLLRGRNIRIGELIGNLASVNDKKLAYYVIQLFWSEQIFGVCSDYAEDRSTIDHFLPDGSRQICRLFLPKDISKICSLRCDFSNQPTLLTIHSLTIETSKGHILWHTDISTASLNCIKGFLVCKRDHDSLVICYSTDPNCVLNIDQDILSQIDGGSSLIVELTPFPLDEILADVLNQDDQFAMDIRERFSGKSTLELDNISNELNPRAMQVSTDLQNIATVLKERLCLYDLTIAKQSLAIDSMRDELLRAEAQIDLLKDVMMCNRGGHQF